MSINAQQFREYIVRAPLLSANVWSPNAEELMMLTAAQETHLGEWVHQVGGPGLGVCSMEPGTHNYVWTYIRSRNLNLPWAAQRSHESLITDFKYAIVMARIRYLPAPPQIPDAKDIEGLAKYYKEFYNTRLGSATVQQATENYKNYTRKAGDIVEQAMENYQLYVQQGG